jgi:hypothetical protein
MSAVIENVQLRLRNLLKKEQSLLQGRAVIVLAPENEGLGFQIAQLILQGF